MNTIYKGNDVLIVDIVTAPSPTGFGPSYLTHRRWEGHPLVSKIVGFAAARVCVDRDTSHVTWYGFDVGAEAGALNYARDILERGAGTVVTFGPHGYVLRMMEARMRDHGFEVSRGWGGMRRASLDLGDEVTLGGMFPSVSLGHTVKMYELFTHDPERRHVRAAERSGALAPEALGERLRVRMDVLVTLHAQLRLGPMGGIVGSLVAREIARPPGVERRVS